MEINQDHFNLLRKIKNSSKISQRELANELGFSLGKLNYILKSLRNRGLITIKNFKKNPNKLKYIYVITPRGISIKTKLTLDYMKRAITEYEKLKSEIKE